VSRIERTFGLDGVDLTIHAGVTFAIMAIGSTIWSHGAAEIMIATVSGASLVALGIRKHLALRQRVQELPGDLVADRLADVEVRLAELERGELRLHELEERLDFTERLLAQAREPERLA
jgi:hypothetical protein